MSYDALKKSMKTEFGCKLSQFELDSNMNCVKRDGDSWGDYLEYLKCIERLMDEDHTRKYNTFCKKVCPEQEPLATMSINEDADVWLVKSRSHHASSRQDEGRWPRLHCTQEQ